MPYQARASLDGAVLRVEEEVVWEESEYEQPAIDPAKLDAWASDNGWQLHNTVDGVPVYRRTQEVPVRRTSLVESEAAVPIALGEGPRYSGQLVPAAGSLMTISAPKGSLRVMSPPSQRLVDLPRRQEMATVSLDRDQSQVLVTLRPSWLRNPLGRSLDSFVAWGPAAWVVGFLAALTSTVVVGRLTAGAEGALSRLLKRKGQRPPAPRRPLRGGGAKLVIRNRRRRG